MTVPRQTILLDNVSVDTDGVGVAADGGSKTVVIWISSGGSFGGGTITLQTSPDGGGSSDTWVTLTINAVDATFTANAARVIDHLGPGLFIRATLTGATAASNVNVKIF